MSGSKRRKEGHARIPQYQLAQNLTRKCLIQSYRHSTPLTIKLVVKKAAQLGRLSVVRWGWWAGWKVARKAVNWAQPKAGCLVEWMVVLMVVNSEL